jgi:hypothetical protein
MLGSKMQLMNDPPGAERGRTNAEIRQWYLMRVAQIPELNERWIQQGLSLKERAEAAWLLRHEARLEARSMMSDSAEVELLRARDILKYGNPDGPTFEFLVARCGEAGLDGDEIYQAIIDGSYRTDTGVNKMLGF